MNPLKSSFVAVVQNEILLNSRRVAPCVLMLLFIANAVLWWGWGPALELGWATNSDYYIVRNLQGFSFLLGLPIFNAVIMADSVIRDFQLGVDPLIFSKPIKRFEYLLAKFTGSFFVLVCCQSAFVVTLFVLQAFHRSGMVVQPFRVTPYFKHFFFFVVISHLILAAFYFAVGTLTRNSKIVYGLAVCFYPVYFAYKAGLLNGLSLRWRVLLDPMLLHGGPSGGGFGTSAETLNQLVISYSPEMIANRLLVIGCAFLVLVFVYSRFRITDEGRVESFCVLKLSTANQAVYFDHDTFHPLLGFQTKTLSLPTISLPSVSKLNNGVRTYVSKLAATIDVEFRLLRAERSLVVLTPLVIFLSTLELALYRVTPEFSYSATYATRTAGTLLLFLVGIASFYTTEAMHRDREVRIHSVLWSTPAPTSVFLLSKFLATILLAIALTVMVGVTAIVIQLLRGHSPIDLSAFIVVYSVILFPSIVFLAAAAIFLNVLLREKYFTYSVMVGMSAALFYLYSIGYRHWVYNPLLYRLWTYADLVGAEKTILLYRIYCLVIAAVALGLARLLFQRKS
jgi:ABC-2 type transport system permease protein